MSLDGPITMDVVSEAESQAPVASVALNAPYAGRQAGAYLMCKMCVKRFQQMPMRPEALGDAALGPEALQAPQEPRCECGAKLHPYVEPVELSMPAKGVLPRLIKFWRAGREDGYWTEKRFFRRSVAERAGVDPRQVRFAYEAGRRAGERLRMDAAAHHLRVQRMMAKSAAAAAYAGANRRFAA